MSGGQDTPQARNPFSPMAVARISDSTDSDVEDEISVPTDAIRRASSYVESYCAAQGTGEVILILGDYGTGKTHLARILVQLAAERLADVDQSLHIGANAENLLRTYQRLIGKLGLDRIRSRVNDFYADVVAEELDGIAADQANLLRNRNDQPARVVRDNSLRESTLQRRVSEKLRDVTENELFGKVLTLLLRQGFDDAVWSWLTGGEPDMVLVERGIDEPISSAIDLLEAMGVLALLFGGREHRFLLVIDEFDQIFSQARSADDSVMSGFQRMLEVFTKSGACLVLCGHPDFAEMLDAGVMQRITHRVDMAGLGVEQASEFIVRAQQAVSHRRTLEPFTRDSVEYLVTLAGGNTRGIIRLCHRAWQIYESAARAGNDWDTPITVPMVQDAAREQFGAVNVSDVRSRVRRVLVEHGWTYQVDHQLGPSSHSNVDYWVTFGDHVGGCAVLLTESILNDADLDGVIRRIAAITEPGDAERAGAQVVLVVVGVLGQDQAAPLRGLAGSDPLVYAARPFADDLAAMVGAAGRRLPSEPVSDPIDSMRQRMEQLGRQQSSIFRSVDQLAGHIDTMRASSDRQQTALRQQLGQLSDLIAAGVGQSAGPPDEPRPGLPPEVGKLFDNALAALAELTQLDPVLRDALSGGNEQAMEVLQQRLESREYIEAVGVTFLIRRTLLAFRESVELWYVGTVTPSAESPARSGDALDAVCRSYDDVTEYLPMFKLNPLMKLAPWSARDSQLADLDLVPRRRRLLEALDDLSPRVQRALRRSLLPNGR